MAITTPTAILRIPPVKMNIVIMLISFQSICPNIKQKAYPDTASKNTTKITLTSSKLIFLMYGAIALLLIITILNKLSFEKGANFFPSVSSILPLVNSFNATPIREGTTIIQSKSKMRPIVSISIVCPTTI